jgi:hypothetical protein
MMSVNSKSGAHDDYNSINESIDGRLEDLVGSLEGHSRETTPTSEINMDLISFVEVK